MKTPREILLERHAQVEPRLDTVRHNVLAKLHASVDGEAVQAGVTNSSLFKAVLRKAWQELIWPSRRAWAGMAAVWLGVLVANLEMKTSPAAVPARPAYSSEIVRAFEEQRRLLSELLPPSSPALVQVPRNGNNVAAPASSGSPKPRPETRNPNQTQIREIQNLT